jgi:hypothetical protein
MSSYSPDTRFTRQQVAAVLTAHGFPIAVGTLQTKASRGGGPPFVHFGPRVLYRWGDALEWAQGRLTAPVGGTFQRDAA